MASKQLEIIMNQVQQLSPEERLQLIKRVAASLGEVRQSGDRQYLVYGEYRDASGHESTEEDFKLAGWHPTEECLNGDKRPGIHRRQDIVGPQTAGLRRDSRRR